MKKLIVPQERKYTDMPQEKKTWYSLILEFGSTCGLEELGGYTYNDSPDEG